MSPYDVQIVCVSVPGGWVTQVLKTGYTFGPVFNDIQDLWKWQRENVFGVDVA